MARPKLKTEATTLKMSPEVRDLWERCAAQEHRSLTNMFEVMVRDCAKRLNVLVDTPSAGVPAPSSASDSNSMTALASGKASATAISKTTHKK
jgi:hypothetical protein